MRVKESSARGWPRQVLDGLRLVGRLARESLRAFAAYECSLRAAALAYHALLAVFPLLLFLVFLASQVLASAAAREALAIYLERTLPALADTVMAVVDQTLRLRGSIGLVGSLGLLWSASAIFTVLSSSFSVIWGATPRPFWWRRLLSLLTVLALGGLFLLSVLLSALAAVRLPWSATPLGRWLAAGVNLGLTVVLLWLMYRVLPNRKVDGRAALVAALLAGLLWEVARVAFGWYLTTGLPQFGLVYGSLASVIILVLWVYYSALVIFLGAVVGATLQREVWPGEEERRRG